MCRLNKKINQWDPVSLSAKCPHVSLGSDQMNEIRIDKAVGLNEFITLSVRVNSFIEGIGQLWKI
ncbi:hypothetical protein NST54_18185 [Caldifermentibacillus hisashii]|uniref:hypothetical protein n=1 Tax=Caldifermentibacillus hisashii TaxID=996558 RepID=UPI0034D5F5E1